MISNFSVARVPRIEFGCGALEHVPALVLRYGSRVLLVTGGRSFQHSAHWQGFTAGLERHGVVWEQLCVVGEPSPTIIDEAVAKFGEYDFDAVVSIGGGSALDAGKAIAGLLRVRRSVMAYIEGVGPELPYEGPSVPFIAVPTTAGTGSEATKNAVLSIQGEEGFKKSFRHEKLVAEYSVIDPDLLESCPVTQVAANGMDALTQLIEAYVSLKSNPFTDRLALSGLRHVRDGLIAWYRHSPGSVAARSSMAYASLVSGIALAQAGLGSVHGLASPLGAFYPMPHGVVCGTLLAVTTDANIEAMRARDPGNPALEKYLHVAEVLCDRHFHSSEEGWGRLIHLLGQWTEQLELPKLSTYGLEPSGLERVVANCRGSSMQTNPIILNDEELQAILRQRL